jgi:hypothetical protein
MYRVVIPFYFFACSSFENSCSIFDVLPLAAIKAVEVGVDGIIVSNHGARQLDYTPATISVLEEVTLYFSTGLVMQFM